MKVKSRILSRYEKTFRIGLMITFLLVFILSVIHIAFGKVFISPQDILRASLPIQ